MAGEIKLNIAEMTRHMLKSPFIVGLICLGLVLRLIGARYGLPYSFIQDEYHEVMRALELGSGQFNMERTGKGGLYFILFIFYAGYFVFLHVLNGVGREEFAQLVVSDPTYIYIIGRYTCIAISCLSLVLVQRVCERFFDKRFAYLAVALVALNTLDVELSRQIRVDVLLAFFSISTFYALFVHLESPSRTNALITGTLIGLATTTKITGVLLVVPFVVVIISMIQRPRHLNSTLFESVLECALCFLGFITVLSVSNPGIWLGLSGYLSFAPEIGLADNNLTDPITGSNLVDGSSSLLQYYLNIINTTFGAFVLPVCVLAGVVGLFKKNIKVIALWSYLATTLLVISTTGNSDMYYPRYLLPIVAPTAILVSYVAAAADEGITHAMYRKGFRAAILICMLCFVVVFGIKNYNASVVLTKIDTRQIAAEWIQANISAGSRIGIEGTKITAARSAVPLRDTAQGISDRMAFYEKVEPRQAKYLGYLQKAYESEPNVKRFALQLYTIESAPAPEDLLDSEVSYIVIEPQRLVYHRNAGNKNLELLNYLRTSERARRIFEINVRDYDGPGPVIEIYALNSSKP